MPSYDYEARDERGERTSGRLTAASKEEAARSLRGGGKFIVRIQEATDETGPSEAEEQIESAAGRIRRDDVINFAHQMAIMVDTGVSMNEALESIAEQTANERFRAVLRDVTRHVQAGGSLSEALARHPKVFPRLMVSLVQASEVSGTMGRMLERISQYMSKQQRTAKKVRGAMMYPAFMFVAALGVTAFLLLFVMPKFATIYTGQGATLPMPTRLLLSVSGLATGYWYVWVPALIVLAVLVVLLARTGPGRRCVDHLKLRMPVLGPMFNKLYVTRAMQTMGTMLDAGVPMLEMVQITRNVTDNTYYRQLWDEVDQKLRDGCQLSDPLSRSALIPKPITRMIHSAEKAGRMGSVFNRIAEFTEEEFDESVKRVTQFIEPAMVTFMGLLIGFVAISLLLPILSVGKVMAGG